jgi:hypothetical protein
MRRFLTSDRFRVLDGIPSEIAFFCPHRHIALQRCTYTYLLRRGAQPFGSATGAGPVDRRSAADGDAAIWRRASAAGVSRAAGEGPRFRGAGLRLHPADLAVGFGLVVLPGALDRKYPTASTDWSWQFVFPAGRICRDDRFGPPTRFHLHESVVQRAVTLLGYGELGRELTRAVKEDERKSWRS